VSVDQDAEFTRISTRTPLICHKNLLNVLSHYKYHIVTSHENTLYKELDKVLSLRKEQASRKLHSIETKLTANT
jgi:hypothetical protein